MFFALLSRLRSSRNAQMLCAAFGLMAVAVVISSLDRRPRPWRIDDVPIAFWAWRNQTPSDADVRDVIAKTKARTIFLRAGQIDCQDGKLSRIRPVNGSLPTGVDLHLVYNATRSLLDQLESIDEKALADAVAAAFQTDSVRAASESARVVGLQIDIDVPTRLLARYERTLKVLRKHVKPGMQLSITGLPTWMESIKLRSTLSQVDFWIPQLYGAEIPEHVDQSIPISSQPLIERFVNGARTIDKPFYAGLAAYSWVLVYSISGSLITVRGDIDPAKIAQDSNLELVERRMFSETAGEWRYVYRARAHGVADGLAIQSGEVLVVDVPSAETLRAAARTVRKLAGQKLMGVCVFRLPSRDDPATLNVDQVALALADQSSSPNFSISLKRDPTRPGSALLEVENQGTANAVGTLKIDVAVAPATIDSVSVPRGASFETICRLPSGNNGTVGEPCSANRANLLRISTHGLRVGQTLRALVVFKTTPPPSLSVSLETQTDDGQAYRKQWDPHLKME